MAEIENGNMPSPIRLIFVYIKTHFLIQFNVSNFDVALILRVTGVFIFIFYFYQFV